MQFFAANNTAAPWASARDLTAAVGLSVVGVIEGSLLAKSFRLLNRTECSITKRNQSAPPASMASAALRKSETRSFFGMCATDEMTDCTAFCSASAASVISEEQLNSLHTWELPVNHCCQREQSASRSRAFACLGELHSGAGIFGYY